MTIIQYYTPPGSYDGAIKAGRRWHRMTGLNKINKIGWQRWQGPPSPAIIRALREHSIAAIDAFPDRRAQS